MQENISFNFENITTIPCGDERMAPQKSFFVMKKANTWVLEASQRPNPRSLWNNLWFEDEVCCLFADTNLGKSILAVQIAEEIAATDKVLYFDFELTDKQFQRRYTNEETGEVHQFSDNFYRIEFDPEAFVDDDPNMVLDQIEIYANEAEAKIIIIDNITWLTNKSESGDTAGQLMSRLIQMKKRNGYSILVLAHTPKRNTNAPLTQNSLAGSKRLANFMDSIFALGTSKKNKTSSRYIKQIKVRSCEMTYGEDNVIEVNIVKENNYLHMVPTGFGTERDNLDEPDEQDIRRGEADDEIARRLREGESYRSIQKATGANPKIIAKISKNLDRYTS